MMFFPVLINGTLAVLWGAMYYHGGPAYLLYTSGLATGVAIMCLAVELFR